MSAKPPLMRSVSWLALCFQVMLVGAVAFVLQLALRLPDWPIAFFIAAIVHLVFSGVMRSWLTRDHRAGIKRFRRGAFAEAAPLFEASHAAMVKRPWIDRFRWILLGSASTMSYREMALCNAAFCYSQVGDGARAVALYERALQAFPDSGLATASLKMLRSVQTPAAASPTSPTSPSGLGVA